MNKKVIFLLFAIAGILVFANLISSQTVNYCAEKTTKGAWCQNVPLEEVDTNYRYAPTSCESTSYCKLGTCVNSQEGVCLENTPERVCENPSERASAGEWFDSSASEIPQCQLGCCLIGDQAAFTTQTRCTQLSSLYGLEANYKRDITSEVQCIASAGPRTKGACVFDDEFQRTCKLTTRSECQDLESAGEIQGVEFHEGFLCSSEQLGTICGPSKQTTLVEGRDEVFFLDTCGNTANIYDADRQNDKEYWEKIIPKSQSCSLTYDNNGNPINARQCGNCDYLEGSSGRQFNRGEDANAPEFGNYICRNLNCRFEGATYLHGESWCASSETTGASNAKGISRIISKDGNLVSLSSNPISENVPGSRYFRMVCYNGDVTVEPCADFRQEICIESSISTARTSQPFRTAACRANRWEDCAVQATEENCMNTDVRDCQWIASGGTSQKCVPRYSPGADFASDSGTGNEQLCLQASETCVVKFEKTGESIVQGFGSGGEFECVENCECLEGGSGGSKESGVSAAWLSAKNNQCLALGDCGSSVNYVGEEGFDDGTGRILIDGNSIDTR